MNDRDRDSSQNDSYDDWESSRWVGTNDKGNGKSEGESHEDGDSR